MSNFLYPFLDGERPDVPALLADLADSAMAKAADSTSLAVATLEREGEHVEALAGEMAERFGAGGRLFTFGNGGSSTDAASVAGLFGSTAVGTGAARPLPRRGHGRADGARQRRRVRSRVLPAADRPRSCRATSPSACRRAGTRGT